MNFCTYKYRGLADPDEVVFASSIALQAFFEGRHITKQDMDTCLQFYRDNVAEVHDPVGRKRPVCMEPYFCVPWYDCTFCYTCCHCQRNIPYADEDVTEEVREVYAKYEVERVRQVRHWQTFHGPSRHSTICRVLGCRRFWGRKGVIFCTEGCCDGTCDTRPHGVAPPFAQHDFDDDYDASSVLMQVIGPPPPNVVIRRWKWDPNKEEHYLYIYPPPDQQGKKNDTSAVADEEQGLIPLEQAEGENEGDGGGAILQDVPGVGATSISVGVGDMSTSVKKEA